MTKIPYLDKALNLVDGCTPVSEGCQSCWASDLHRRFHGQPYDVNCPIKTHPERLKEALGWRTPRRVGVCFTSDLFHKDVPDEFIDKVFAVMALTPQHTYLLLTKRPERMQEYLQSYQAYAFDAILNGLQETPRGLHACPLPNVWLGVSCENQARADERIPLLLETPAAHRWVSLEPLLGAVGLSPFLQGGIWFGKEGRGPSVTLPGLDWVVVGGESGPKARPCHIDWIRDINQQCEAAGVKRYIKQIGARPYGWITESLGYKAGEWPLRDRKGENPDEWPADLRVRELPEEMTP